MQSVLKCRVNANQHSPPIAIDVDDNDGDDNYDGGDDDVKYNNDKYHSDDDTNYARV